MTGRGSGNRSAAGGYAVVMGGAALAALAWAAAAGAAPAFISGGSSAAGIYSQLADGLGRPGMSAEAPAGPRWGPDGSAGAGDGGARTPSPFLAGLFSAVVPGSGQLLLGQRRGWVYLGAEAAAWFSEVSLRDAGNQSERDYKRYADRHWDWERYQSVAECGDGLGPVDFEREQQDLERQLADSRDDYYDSIGRLDAYACGWDTQADRSSYQNMRGDADALFRSARVAVTVVFLNHLVSAVDAAKSAADRRRAARGFGWNLGVTPAGRGDLAMNLSVRHGF